MDAFRWVKDNKIVKNASSLVIGQVLSRLLSIFYVAALARYVGVGGIGKLSTATALNGLLVLMVGPGLNTLLIRDVAADVGKAESYISNMLFLRGVLGFPFILVTTALAHLAGYPSDTLGIIHIYTIAYFLDTIADVLVGLFRATERMEYDAGGQIGRDVINVVLSLVAIHLHWSLLGIALMSLVAQMCKLLFMVVLVYGGLSRPRMAISFKTSKELLLASLPFGVLLILHTVQAQAGTFILSLYWTADTVGVYSAAYTLIAVLLLLPLAFSTAIFPAFSRLYSAAGSELQRFYQLSYKYLLIVGYPLGLGTMLVGDRVLFLIYGDEFASAGSVLRILAVFLFTLVGYSNGPLLNAVGRQRFLAGTQGIAVFGTVSLSIILGPMWGPSGVAVAFVAPGIATYFVHSIACHRQFGLSLPWLTMGKVFIATIFMGLIVWIAEWMGVHWLVVVFLASPIAYFGAVIALGVVHRGELAILASAANKSWTPAVTMSSSHVQ